MHSFKNFFFMRFNLNLFWIWIFISYIFYFVLNFLHHFALSRRGAELLSLGLLSIVWFWASLESFWSTKSILWNFFRFALVFIRSWYASRITRLGRRLLRLDNKRGNSRRLPPSFTGGIFRGLGFLRVDRRHALLRRRSWKLIQLSFRRSLSAWDFLNFPLFPWRFLLV